MRKPGALAGLSFCLYQSGPCNAPPGTGLKRPRSFKWDRLIKLSESGHDFDACGCRVDRMQSRDCWPCRSNSAFTGSQNLKWATEHSMIQCRRHEISLFDADEGERSRPSALQCRSCWRFGLLLGAQWDASHRMSRYRTWLVACQVPTVSR
jgi:hypothetical protein